MECEIGTFIAQLKQHISRGVRLHEQPTYWFGFHEHPYWADHYFAYKRPYGKEVKRLRRLRIQYIIADEFFLNVMVDQKHFTKQEIQTFLKNECGLVATIKDFYYGKGYGTKKYNVTRIYKVIY